MFNLIGRSGCNNLWVRVIVFKLTCRARNTNTLIGKVNLLTVGQRPHSKKRVKVVDSKLFRNSFLDSSLSKDVLCVRDSTYSVTLFKYNISINRCKVLQQRNSFTSNFHNVVLIITYYSIISSSVLLLSLALYHYICQYNIVVLLHLVLETLDPEMPMNHVP